MATVEFEALNVVLGTADQLSAVVERPGSTAGVRTSAQDPVVPRGILLRLDLTAAPGLAPSLVMQLVGVLENGTEFDLAQSPTAVTAVGSQTMWVSQDAVPADANRLVDEAVQAPVLSRVRVRVAHGNAEQASYTVRGHWV